MNTGIPRGSKKKRKDIAPPNGIPMNQSKNLDKINLLGFSMVGSTFCSSIIALDGSLNVLLPFKLPKKDRINPKIEIANIIHNVILLVVLIGASTVADSEN